MLRRHPDPADPDEDDPRARERLHRLQEHRRPAGADVGERPRHGAVPPAAAEEATVPLPRVPEVAAGPEPASPPSSAPFFDAGEAPRVPWVPSPPVASPAFEPHLRARAPEDPDGEAGRWQAAADAARAALLEGRLAPAGRAWRGLVVLGVLAVAAGFLLLRASTASGADVVVPLGGEGPVGAVAAGSAAPAPADPPGPPDGPATAAPAPPPAPTPAAPTPVPGAAPPTGTVVVSVAGAVGRPGLVRLPSGARVGDALDAAGGALPGTDLTLVALARPLVDGEHVLVGVEAPPGLELTPPAPGAPSAGGPAPGSSAGVPGPGSADDGLLDLNTATAAQLEDLPGIGPVLAERMVTFREQEGGFRSVEDLQDVSGVGPARFAELAPRVVVR